MAKIYEIPVTSIYYGKLKIKADDLEQAIEIAYEQQPEVMDYLDDSYEVDLEGIQELNKLTDEDYDILQTIQDDIYRNRP